MTSNIELTQGLLSEEQGKRQDKAANFFLAQYTHEETKSFFDKRRSVLKNICFFLFVLLPFWQVPFWCSESNFNDNNCKGGPEPLSEYSLSGIEYMRPRYFLIYELVLIVLIMFCLGKKTTAGDDFNYHKYVVFPMMAFCLFDTVATLAAGYFTYPNYLGSFIRPLAFIVNSKVLRGLLWRMLRIVLEARRMLAYLAITIVFFAWFATLTIPDNETFGNLGNSIYIFITLLDGENFPGIIKDQYASSKASILYYFLYMMIGIYIILGLLLAIFYQTFHTIAREERVENADMEFKYIQACWNSLTAHEAEADKKTIDKKTLLRFFNSLRSEKYATNALKLKKLPDSRNDEVIYRILDRNDDGQIDKDEFERFCILIKMVSDLPDLEGSDKIARYDRCLGFLKAYLTNPWVEFFYLFITVANLGLLFYVSEMKNETPDWWIWVQLGVCIFYIIEVVFALLSGASQYLNSVHHVLETFMSGWSLFLILDALWKDTHDAREIIAYFVLIRMFRVFRLLLNIEEWNLLFKCIGKAIPRVFDFFIGMFAIFYIYALAGEVAFGEREGATASHLYNFNDFGNSLISIAIFLFAPWFNIVEEDEADASTGLEATSASEKWFCVFLYFSTVLLISNIVIPIIFGIFDFEYKQHKELKKNRQLFPEAEHLDFYGKACNLTEKEFEIIVEREFLRRKGLDQTFSRETLN